MHVRFLHVRRCAATMADMRHDLSTITLLLMVRNIKCGYLFSELGQADYSETKFERIRRNFRFATKPHLVQYLH